MKENTQIDAYISEFPENVQDKLREMREILRAALPNASEVISYKMPAFKTTEVLVYYAGYKNHIGFYPTSSGIREFQSEFGQYQWSKGAVQFPLNEALPVVLIQRMAEFRREEVARKRSKKP